jgi:hypothetical protein
MNKEEFVAALPSLPIDKLVRRFVTIREARAAFNSEAEKSDKEFKETLKAIEIELLRRAQDEGVEGFKTEFGTTYRDVNMSASFADEDTFYKFVRESGDLEFFERRLKIAHLKEYMENHEGQLPPGINVFREYTMRVRKK